MCTTQPWLRLVVLVVCFLMTVSVANAVIVKDLGNGWQASWDDSLAGLVDVTSHGIVNVGGDDVMVIQKTAEFTQGPAPLTGLFPSIPIAFTQTGATTVDFFAIDDEIITNSTGVDWTDFHMEVLDSGDALFDPAKTALSGGSGPIGFTISPFTQAEFSPDNQQLDIWGGVVADGEQWFPGNGATNGNLWIQLNPTGTTTFTLKETPTPEPATMMLLGLGGLVYLRKRIR